MTHCLLHPRSADVVRQSLAVAALALACVAPRAEAVSFSNVTAAAGINHISSKPYLPGDNPTSIQEQAGGAAAGDFDGDGWPDLYITRYWDADVLYRNNHDGTFSDVTATAFAGGIGVHETNGASWGDIDNDGDLDLMVSTMNESRHLLYINSGGAFTEQGSSRGIVAPGGLPTTSGTSIAMGDYDRDGYLDMYVTEWRSFTQNSVPAQSRLYHNLGAANPGHFADVTAAAGATMDKPAGQFANKSLGFTPRFSDIDRDGITDLAVASDGQTSRLFWGDGDGTFTNGTAVAGDLTTRLGSNDMGFVLADFNGDGLLDWYTADIGSYPFDTSGDPPLQHPFGNRMFLNDGDRTFTDVTDAVGVRNAGWAWGAAAFDYDHDGDLDLFQANGFRPTSTLNEQSIFFENDGSRTNPHFVVRSNETGVTDVVFGRGVLNFDYDRDGDLDLYISNLAAPPILYRNDGGAEAGDWLEVKLVGVDSNRDGIGAYVTVTPDLAQPTVKYVVEADGSTNYLGQDEFLLHFGLGDLTTIARVDVLWPSGQSQQFANVATDQLVTITESLRADFDGDGDVDGVDLARWSQHSGLAAGALPSDGDADRDGDVDGADLLLWQCTLGRTTFSGQSLAAAAAAIPEPTTAALAGMLCAACVGLTRGSLPWARRLRRRS